jgi:hypothetical protein
MRTQIKELTRNPLDCHDPKHINLGLSLPPPLPPAGLTSLSLSLSPPPSLVCVCVRALSLSIPLALSLSLRARALSLSCSLSLRLSPARFQILSLLRAYVFSSARLCMLNTITYLIIDNFWELHPILIIFLCLLLHPSLSPILTIFLCLLLHPSLSPIARIPPFLSVLLSTSYPG